jgi:hypothetical protein
MLVHAATEERFASVEKDAELKRLIYFQPGVSAFPLCNLLNL